MTPSTETMIAALTAAGFHRIGQWTGRYVRFGWPGEDGRSRSLIVPEDPSFADFDILMGETLAALQAAAEDGKAAAAALAAVGQAAADA